MGNKRLYRSSTNCMLAGVCGGIAEYFNIDPTLVRLAWVLFSALGGSGVLAYIIAAIVMPDESANYNNNDNYYNDNYYYDFDWN